MPATFRLATAADIATVAALVEAAYAHYVPLLGGRKPRPMLDDHGARIARGETYLIEEAAGPVGVTSMGPEGDAMHIFNIAIHPDAQGHGLVREVMGFAEALARSAGARRLSLYTNALMKRNRAIYPHLGFTEIRQEDVGDGHRAVYFERPLPP